ncbi:MAG: dTDP-glucose 4,6-dehydratase [Rickettsiaceae bacterium]|jgi:dTDP-glucose 4,6-dehydratase|nr:dTDP-glucose 4,6-dehydratase [Rickettsiaceae bacterium]
MKKLLVTGGCGFIGSCFVLRQIKDGNLVVNLDNLTYAANPKNLSDVENHQNYHFVKGDISDQKLVSEILQKFNIDTLVNFAAESHVDNSIANPGAFIQTNINGTFSLLSAALNYWQNLDEKKQKDFRFVHISTDEVYGSLTLEDPKFNENNKYQPNSPYSASKAASDHLVRAWNETYKLPTIITNCSNNFGARQHAEKLIPKVISSCLTGKDIPIYGNGKNIRDWIYVEDHCFGIKLAITKGKIGENYCFGGDAERQNIDIAKQICAILDQLKPKADGTSYSSQIKFVEDRKGHDFRYAIDSSKAKKELGFKLEGSFEEKLKDTVKWYLSQSTKN